MNELKPVGGPLVVTPILPAGRKPRFLEIWLDAVSDGNATPGIVAHRLLDFRFEFFPGLVRLRGFGDVRIGLVDVEVDIELEGLETCSRRFPPMHRTRDMDVSAEVVDTANKGGRKFEGEVNFSALLKTFSGAPVEDFPLKLSTEGPGKGSKVARYFRYFEGVEVDRRVEASGTRVFIQFLVSPDQRHGDNAHLKGACDISFIATKTGDIATESGDRPAVAASSGPILENRYKIIKDNLSAKFPGRLNPARLVLERRLAKDLAALGALASVRWSLANV